jgi:phosphoribosyl 1,2-cyclic phosphate phosphodiesterase
MPHEEALPPGEELDATETRLVHVGHYYITQAVLMKPLVVDGETYDLG